MYKSNDKYKDCDSEGREVRTSTRTAASRGHDFEFGQNQQHLAACKRADSEERPSEPNYAEARHRESCRSHMGLQPPGVFVLFEE